MAPRPFWKGYMKLSLVTCPVAMTPATTESEKLRFHTINRKTGNRVRSEYADAVTGKAVGADDEARGFETEEGRHVIVEDEEIEAVALESTRTIDIETFVPKDSIGWIWYDRPHYLQPDDPVGEEAFAVIRDAMAARQVVGISRLVLYRRERAVMLEPRDKGIVLWTLRYGDEVRDADEHFAGVSEEKVDSRLVAMIKTLISERSRPWDPAMARDVVQERLASLIENRTKGAKSPKRARKSAETAENNGNVINIMDALKRSIAAEKKRPPGKK